MESPLLRELKGLLVSSPEESVRLQKESPLLRELEGLLGILEEPFAPDDPKRFLLGVPAPKELEGLLVSSPVESVRLQKEKDLFWESPLLGS